MANKTVTKTPPLKSYLQATKPAAPTPERAKALAYLKEYVRQMRAAGFDDDSITKKLRKIGTVTVPGQLPENFGQTGVWASGMADEFRNAAKTNTQMDWVTPEDLMPSPDEFLNYMPGGTGTRLPSYKEFKGQDDSPFFNPSGKFSQAKLENLRKKLQEYASTYKGSKIGSTSETMEAGIAGLPQDIGQQYYQEFVTMKNQKTTEGQEQKDAQTAYDKAQSLAMEVAKMGIEVSPEDTYESILKKVALKAAEDTPTAQDKKAQIINIILEYFASGQWTDKDAYQYGLDNGILLDLVDLADLYSQYSPQQ